MTVRVKLFARARDVIGADCVSVTVPQPTTVAGLRRALCDQFPAMLPISAGLLFAVDAKYAGDTTPISSNADIACFPPVSGG